MLSMGCPLGLLMYVGAGSVHDLALLRKHALMGGSIGPCFEKKPLKNRRKKGGQRLWDWLNKEERNALKRGRIRI